MALFPRRDSGAMAQTHNNLRQPKGAGEGPMTSILLSRRAVLTAPAILAAAGTMPALAQGAYPARPVTLVVTFAAGGGVDTVSRLFADALGRALKERMIVENRGGGGTVLGTQAVTTAAPDGHTLLAAPTTLVINAAVRPSLPYDWQRDLVPVGLMAKLPFVAVVRPQSPLKGMADLVPASQSRILNYASGGVGTVAHLAGELFALRTGARMQHVPYRGEGPSIADVLNGSLDLTFSTLAAVAGQIEGGQLRALGVTAAERASLLKDVPTVEEQGVAPFDVSAWVMLMAPAQTPAPIVDHLRGALRETLRGAPLMERLATIGAVPAAADMDPKAFLAREAATWAEVIREAKLSF